MKIKSCYLMFLIFASFPLCQNINSYVWNGTSIATSDNIDALNLNPAGLGVKRNYQYGLMIQSLPIPAASSSPLEYVKDSGEYIGFINRTSNGWSMEIGYNTYTKESNYSIGYGFVLFDGNIINKLYAGFKYQNSSSIINYSENDNFEGFSYGLLYRPHNFISLGLTSFQGKNSIGIVDANSVYSNQKYDYKYNRMGIAIRPLSFFNKTSKSFINYSNLTLGYDRTNNNTDYKLSDSYDLAYSYQDILLNEKKYTEQYFINFAITPGLELTYTTFKNTNGKDDSNLEISFNFKTKGVSYSNNASNGFYGFNKNTNSLVYYDYYENQDGLEFGKKKNKKYIKMTLEGNFIEEKPNVSFFSSINPFSPKAGTQLKAWIDKIDEINNDEKIDGLIINLGNIGAGFAKRREMYKALMRLKENNKEIIVYSAKDVSNLNYHLISMADEIYIHRMSSINLKGLTIEPMFFRGLLDTLSLVPEVIRVSPYKTAADAFLNRKMSDEMRENYTELLDDLYNVVVTDISNGRDWKIDKTMEIIDNGPYFNSSTAIEQGLITGVMFPDEFNKYINEKGENKPSIIKWENHKEYDDFVYEWHPKEKDKIAIIYAVGGIMSGKSNPGPAGSTIMGDKTIMKAIKKAREDKDIKAIVLRVDSGGGSALASDMMWKEVYNTTTKDSTNKKPFIVSMSDVAASGGYYISCQADTIIADEATITGSIGVIWARLNFSELLKRIGINSELIKKGENSDFASSSRLLNDNEIEKLQNNIIDIYNIFKERVIEGRENLNDIEALDEVALGRVWTGTKAKEHGLVDITGGFYDAINVAKKSALISDEQEVDIVELPRTGDFSLIDLFSSEDEESKIEFIDFKTILPNELAEELEVFDIIPVIMDNEIQFLMPYKIKID